MGGARRASEEGVGVRTSSAGARSPGPGGFFGEGPGARDVNVRRQDVAARRRPREAREGHGHVRLLHRRRPGVGGPGRRRAVPGAAERHGGHGVEAATSAPVRLRLPRRSLPALPLARETRGRPRDQTTRAGQGVRGRGAAARRVPQHRVGTTPAGPAGLRTPLGRRGRRPVELGVVVLALVRREPRVRRTRAPQRRPGRPAPHDAAGGRGRGAHVRLRGLHVQRAGVAVRDLSMRRADVSRVFRGVGGGGRAAAVLEAGPPAAGRRRVVTTSVLRDGRPVEIRTPRLQGRLLRPGRDAPDAAVARGVRLQRARFHRIRTRPAAVRVTPSLAGPPGRRGARAPLPRTADSKSGVRGVDGSKGAALGRRV
mmetsp:Transcript_26990/g.83111  ORF Transcript_26990/g.83111 Transcript_26990/m.83111 type:complete len:369 (+) Transcript_26990:1218-2324(+)